MCHVILERKRAFFVFETSYFIFPLSLERREEKKLWIDQEKKGSVCRLWDRLMKWKKYSAAHTRKSFFYIRYLSFSVLCLKKKKEKKEERKKKTFTTRIAITSNAHDTKKNYDCCVAWTSRREMMINELVNTPHTFLHLCRNTSKVLSGEKRTIIGIKSRARFIHRLSFLQTKIYNIM